jgi:hypothetical protein
MGTTDCLPLLNDWCSDIYPPAAVYPGTPAKWEFYLCRPTGVSAGVLTFADDKEFEGEVTPYVGKGKLWTWSHGFRWPAHPHSVVVSDGACLVYEFTYDATDSSGHKLAADKDYWMEFLPLANELRGAANTRTRSFHVSDEPPHGASSSPTD